MNVPDELREVAAVLGENARIAMLWSLLGGEERPAGELAFIANVSAQSASVHLAKLVDAGMISYSENGRNRFYRIATPDVAHAVESIAVLMPSAVRELRSPMLPVPEMRTARTCYDHLAGVISVNMAQAMQDKGLISPREKDFTITNKGNDWLKQQLNIDVADLRQTRRATARQCLDWSERRFHIAGALGASLLTEMKRRKWIAEGNEKRVIRLTLTGRRKLSEMFGIQD